MPTASENQPAVYSSVPADLGAVTITAGGTFYMVGYANGPGSSDLNGATVVGATTAVLDSISNFYVGEAVLLDGTKSTAEIAIVSVASGSTLTFASPLQFAHADEATVVGSSAAIVPSASGRIRVRCHGDLTGNNTTDVMQAQITIINGTTTAGPTAGGAAAGTAVGNISNVTELTGVLTQPFECEAILGSQSATNTAPSGGAVLVQGTPYLFDLQVTSTTSAKTVQAKHVTWMIEEI